jgi:hypothetical protein
MVIKNLPLTLAAILILPSYGSSQTAISETRFDKHLRSNFHINLVTAADHLPLFLNNPLDHWTAPKSSLLIDGISFDQFPFNLASINLLPVDIPVASKIEHRSNPRISLLNSTSTGYVNFINNNNLTDSFEVKFRLFTGSETGDPLIHIYTRDDLIQTNKNKIPPSGSFSLSNKSEDLSYQLSSGYYGNFSTGSVNDGIISNKSRYFYGKQNKQIFVGTRLNFKDKYSFGASGISYYGWDIPPFMTTFIHFETYLYTLRASAIGIFDDFSVFIVNDGSITKVHNINRTDPGKVHLTGYKLIPVYERELDAITLKLSGELNYNTAKDLTVPDNTSQKFFVNNPSETGYAFSVLSSYKIKQNVKTQINVRYDRHYVQNSALSGYFNFEWLLSEHDLIEFNISSVSLFPGLTELYGSFYSIVRQDTLRISGNRSLLAGRNTHAGIKYQRGFGKFDAQIELFKEQGENQIRQRTLRTITEAPGEILREAVYINAPIKNTSGMKLSLMYDLSPVKILTSWNYTDNSDIPYFPRNSVFAKLTYRLPVNSDLTLTALHNSRTLWEEYIVEPENDFYIGSGNNGILGNNLSFDLTYYQYLNEFLFLKNLVLGLIVSNIFNNKVRYLPAGNFLERTISFSLQSKF